MNKAIRTRCKDCGEQVLHAELESGLAVIMDLAEILPRERCRTCLSKRQLYESCWRCGTEPNGSDDDRYVGERLDGVLGVVIGETKCECWRTYRSKPDSACRVCGGAGYVETPARVFILAGDAGRHAGDAVYRAHRCALVSAAA